ECVWSAEDLQPVVKIVQGGGNHHCLAAVIARLSPVIECLADRVEERERFLDEIASVVGSRWAEQKLDDRARDECLAALNAFADLVPNNGVSKWRRET